MKKLQQIGSLIEYQEEFERLDNRVHGWSEEALIGMFGWIDNGNSSGSKDVQTSITERFHFLGTYER